MVVKSKVGRRRYIVGRDSAKLDTLMREIKGIDERAKIIHRDGSFFILRVRHWYKEEAIKALNENGVETLITTDLTCAFQ